MLLQCIRTRFPDYLILEVWDGVLEPASVASTPGDSDAHGVVSNSAKAASYFFKSCQQGIFGF